jgi:hypothetical protein
MCARQDCHYNQRPALVKPFALSAPEMVELGGENRPMPIKEI